MTPPWFESLLEFWTEEGFNPSGLSLVLAVSGGCDSVAMLELFSREVAPRFHCRLRAVHLHHGLREAATADQSFVSELCRDRDIPLDIISLDPATRSRGQSLEMWGRERRYAAFQACRKSHGADWVLTAHHRDDVVETFCLRLWRGTGLNGLASIGFRRVDGVLRPLLPIPQLELPAWLSTLGTGWREDESNADVGIPRNWIRHRLLPAWRESEPDLEERIFRMTQTTSKLLPLWEHWMQSEFPITLVQEQGGIPLAWLRDPAIGTEVLRRCLPLFGVQNPVPEMLSEILRQVGSLKRIRVRVNENLDLLEKKDCLVLVPTAMRDAGSTASARA